MTQVKICGLSEPVTLNAALDAGADFVGFVFFAKSPRNVTIEQARVLAGIASGTARVVALTVDANDELLSAITEQVKPDYIQAHGNESPERVDAIKRLTGARVIKAFKVATASDIAAARNFGNADLLLFDAKAPETRKDALPGGNGHAFDWTLLGRDAGTYMLAGGLTPSNVADAIRVTHAPIVDVSSGVESAPGVKDETLIRTFIAAAKAAR